MGNATTTSSSLTHHSHTQQYSEQNHGFNVVRCNKQEVSNYTASTSKTAKNSTSSSGEFCFAYFYFVGIAFSKSNASMLVDAPSLLDFLESLNFCALKILLFAVSDDTVKVRVSPIAFNPTKFVPGSFEETAQNWSTSFSSDSKIEPKWRPTALAAKEMPQYRRIQPKLS